MKYLFILLTLVFTLSCKSSKRAIVQSSNLTEEKIETKTETLGIIDSIVKIDQSEIEIEITKYEPIYFKQNGKDTVVLKPITYKKINSTKSIEEVTKVDTTSLKIEKIKTSQDSSNRKLDSEFKGYNVISSLTKGIIGGILSPFLRYVWVLGFILIVPIIFWIKRKISNNKSKS
jgi:hypothetical protein